MKNVKEFLFEIQFSYKLDKLSKKQLNKEQIQLFKKLSSHKEGEIIKLQNKDLESCIIFILRECINALIYNTKEEFLFGYIYDFFTLVCRKNLTESQMKTISDFGFVAEEFYYKFE